MSPQPDDSGPATDPNHCHQSSSSSLSSPSKIAHMEQRQQPQSQQPKMAINHKTNCTTTSSVFMPNDSKSQDEGSIKKQNPSMSSSNNNSNNNKDRAGKAKRAKAAKKDKSKKNKNGTDSTPSKPAAHKNLVEELKLFQNSSLLNQRDPLEQLHQQLNELIKNDDDGKDDSYYNDKNNNKRVGSKKSAHSIQKPSVLDSSQSTSNNTQQEHAGQQCLSSMQSNNISVRATATATATNAPINANENNETSSSRDKFENGDDIFTVKKGILWQQQNYDRFHQRLFSRWKKRYFILTTDYLVCFKRSSSKVGRSEMGKFLYKTSLNDITKLEWNRPKKSDKGAIILHINKQFDLFLWSKENLDEWMSIIEESIERLKLRRSAVVVGQKVNPHFNQNNHLIKSASPFGGAEVSRSRDSDPAALKRVANDSFTETSKDTGSAQPDFMDNNNNKNPNRLDPNHHSNNVLSGGNSESPQKGLNQGSESVTRSGTNEEQTNNESPKAITSEKIFDVGCPFGRDKCKDDDVNDKGRPRGKSPNDDKLNNQSRHDRTGFGGNEPMMINDTERPKSNVRSQQSASSENESPSAIDSAKSQPQAKARNNPPSSRLQSASSVHVSGQSDDSIDLSSERRKQVSATPGDRNANKNPVKSSNRCEMRLSSRDFHSNENSAEREAAKKCELQNNQQSASKRSEKLEVEADELARQPKAAAGASVVNDLVDEAASGGGAGCAGGPSVKKEDKPHDSNVFGQQANKQQRPSSNLIRRDDSWQSLVSLTRIGKGPLQAHRSLYAQHIMPNNDAASIEASGDAQLYHNNHCRNLINIESTVTPIRGPLFRQQSVQYNGARKFRPLPPIGQQPQSTSFDVAAPIPNSPLQSNQRSTSYHHKLLQLQLLHNSNNVDYIRTNNADGGLANGAYSIYGGPESTVNHYGYYSMRSNLKSATSEFSFIRPSSSSNNNNNNQPLPQSTLPHQNSFYVLDSQSTQHHQNPIRSSLVMANNELAMAQLGSSSQQNSKSSRNSINNIGVGGYSPSLGNKSGQYLVNPVTGERLVNCGPGQQLFPQSPLPLGNDVQRQIGELDAPNRELPLKPNKKRSHHPSDVNNNNNSNALTNGNLSKNSSITSSIVYFFRRAFSRRGSKRGHKRGTKLRESFSSSLGAFDESFSGAQFVKSAFSTGSKSVDGQGPNFQQHNMQSSQRMVDMIEAFTNRTIAPQENNGANCLDSNFQVTSQPPVTSSIINHSSYNSPKMTPQSRVDQFKASYNHFGSPLHKSNSMINTSIGLSHELLHNNQQMIIYDNDILSANARGSPLMTRSTKVASANLTPLLSQREVLDKENQARFLSPRNSNRLEHLPRPSSIYGQPSLISSPVIGRDERNNFGLHRSSLHGHYQDRVHNPVLDVHRRHHQMMKASFLDTTKEVAEEISTPTNESVTFNYEIARKSHISLGESNNIMRDVRDENVLASPRVARLNQRQQMHAVVSPILQSSTMDAIYDNHPMLNDRAEMAQYSHYDNHQPFLVEPQRVLTENATKLNSSSNPTRNFAQNDTAAQNDTYSRRILDKNPSKSSRQQQSSLVKSSSNERSTVMDMMLANSKPSAIIAPTTPNHSNSINYGKDNVQIPLPTAFGAGGGGGTYSRANGASGYAQSSQIPQLSTRSPMLSRKITTYQSHYQQSPLVSRQTRVLNRPDGVQTTIISDKEESFRGGVQAVVNIAGAPGINLDPSLAESLLRGTNINAYECSTMERLNSTQPNSNSKTFLVSTRLSKSMANNGATSGAKEREPLMSSGSTTTTSSSRNEPRANIVAGGDATFLRSSRDELSTGSRSINSSISRASSKKSSQGSRQCTTSSQEDQQDESSSSDTHITKSTNSKSTTSISSQASSSRALKRRGRGSSVEHSDEVTSRASSLDEPEQRNWITSKLAE